MEKVSIIIPVYNKEKYLNRCLQSIDRQGYDNIEVILIDDGSVDKSLQLCEEYKENSKYECIVLHQDNMGPSAARNRGLKAATGDFIMFVDADDSIVNNCIYICMEQLKNTYYDFIEFDFQNVNGCYNKDSFESVVIENEDIIKNLLNGKNIKPVVCGAIYSENIVKNLRFPEDMKWGEDSSFKLMVCLKCKKISYINIPLYINYLVPNTLSRMQCNEAMLNSVDLLIKFYIQNLGGKNLDKDAGRYIFNTAFSYMSLVILQNKKQSCIDGFQKMKKYADDNFIYADIVHKIAYRVMKYDKLYFMIRSLYNKI